MTANKFFDYRALDWSQTDKALALDTGLTVNQVRYQRTKLGMPKATRTGAHDWSTLDWNKQDVELADELKCGSSLVGYWRRKLKRPRSPRFHKCRSHLLQQHIEQLRQKTAVWDWTKQDVELADAFGLTRERIRQIRVRLGLPKSPNHRCRR